MRRRLTSHNPNVAWRRALAVTAAATLALAACGGGDDDASTSTTTTTLAPAVTTTLAPPVTTTLAPAAATTVAPTPVFTTDGASIMVANSSGINGAATRMTDRLAIAGFTMVDPTNGSEGQLEITKVYYDPSNASAQAVAESVRSALGGGDIQLFEMGVPAPTETGDIGDASVLVSMGNDAADKSLEELQGLVVVEEEPTEDAEDTEDTESDDG